LLCDRASNPRSPQGRIQHVRPALAGVACWGLGPCRAARARRGTPPRLRALCVDFHAGERLGAGGCSPRQHWPRAGSAILFLILHFLANTFTLTLGKTEWRRGPIESHVHHVIL